MTIPRLLLFLLITFVAIGDSTGNDTPTEGYFSERGYDVKFYHIDLKAERSNSQISGSTEIILDLFYPWKDSLVFDMGNNLIVDSVFAGHRRTDFVHSDNLLVIHDFDKSGNRVAVKVYYRSGDSKGMRGGIYSSSDRIWDSQVTWTLSEPFDSEKWFPCNQDLNDKADSVYVFITTSSENLAGSNGILENTVKLPGNMVRYEWKSRHPVAYYLISFAVSNYTDYSFYTITESGDSVHIVNFIYNDPAFIRANRETIDMTAGMINLFTSLFGPYPYRDEKYGHCIVPSGGGMEHQTMTTLDRFSFNLVAHELAHQWFGNFVTCGSWQDIWINEGFASYAEYLALQFLKPGTEADNWMDEAHRYSRIPSGSVYVPVEDSEDVARIFDFGLSYKKGAAIIHMIRHEIGNDMLFFSILKDYLFKFGNGNAIGMDFCDLLEEKTGTDFTDFFNQWYFGEGYPVFSIKWEQKEGVLKITSTETVTGITPFYNMQLDFRLHLASGRDTVITRKQLAEVEIWEIAAEEEITDIEADPFRWLVAGFSVVKEASVKELILEEQ